MFCKNILFPYIRIGFTTDIVASLASYFLLSRLTILGDDACEIFVYNDIRHFSQPNDFVINRKKKFSPIFQIA